MSRTLRKYRRQHIRFSTEPGVEIEGNLYVPSPSAGRRPAVLLVADSGPYFQAAIYGVAGKQDGKEGPRGSDA